MFLIFYNKHGFEFTEIRFNIYIYKKLNLAYSNYTDTWTKVKINSLSEMQFNKAIANLIESTGYETQIVSNLDKKEVDIIAKKDWRKKVIQTEKNSKEKKVDESKINKLDTNKNKHNASDAAIYTNTQFTKKAIKKAKKLEIEAINGKELKNSLNKNKILVNES